MSQSAAGLAPTADAGTTAGCTPGRTAATASRSAATVSPGCCWDSSRPAMQYTLQDATSAAASPAAASPAASSSAAACTACCQSGRVVAQSCCCATHACTLHSLPGDQSRLLLRPVHCCTLPIQPGMVLPLGRAAAAAALLSRRCSATSASSSSLLLLSTARLSSTMHATGWISTSTLQPRRGQAGRQAAGRQVQMRRTLSVHNLPTCTAGLPDPAFTAGTRRRPEAENPHPRGSSGTVTKVSSGCQWRCMAGGRR